MSRWDTIESDPAVFSSLLKDLGCTGATLQELYTLDDFPPNSLGLLFLHKYVKGGARPVHVPPPSTVSPPWYAVQTVANACGTQALLHVILNAGGAPFIRLGGTLENFKDFTSALPPSDRGNSLELCDPIRTAHNSFARPEPFIREERVAKKGERGKAPFHFLCYVPVNGLVYELDGLAGEPVCLGPITPSTPWTTLAQTAVEGRMASYQGSELRFTLLAVVKDPQVSIMEEGGALARGLEETYGRLLSLGEQDKVEETPDMVLSRLGFKVGEEGGEAEAEAEEEEDSTMGGSSSNSLLSHYADLRTRAGFLKERWEDEQVKLHKWAKENAERRHNFVPLIMQLLEGLAGKGVLEEERKRAVEANLARIKRAKAEGRDPAEEDDS